MKKVNLKKCIAIKGRKSLRNGEISIIAEAVKELKNPEEKA